MRRGLCLVMVRHTLVHKFSRVLDGPLVSHIWCAVWGLLPQRSFMCVLVVIRIFRQGLHILLRGRNIMRMIGAIGIRLVGIAVSSCCGGVCKHKPSPRIGCSVSAASGTCGLGGVLEVLGRFGDFQEHTTCVFRVHKVNA